MLSTCAILRIRKFQRRPIFMCVGALPRIYGPVKERLDQNFGNGWIGRGRPLAWPLCSPDLNPCDFYL